MEKKQQQYLSPNQRAYKRLMKNKPAIFGMIIIALSVFIALFSYVLIPDSTPNANGQVLEIATESPGFSVKMLKQHKNRKLGDRSIFKLLKSGRDNPYKMIPINEYKIEGDKIIVGLYSGVNDEITGKPITSDRDTINLVDVVYALDNEPNLINEGSKISFVNLNKQQQEANIAELQKIVENEHIVNQYYLFGTDKFGRDNFSRLVLGVRISLSIGLMAVLISLFIGISMGAIAGYFRGVVDDIIMWIINVFWSIPLLLLVFAMVLALGRDFWQIYLAVGLTMWIELARVVRGEFLSIREKEYVEAAQSLGFGDFRIIVRHILPNLVGPIVVVTAANFATAIIVEAGLSFLGIGVQPPIPSWGSMLKEYYSYVGTSKAFLALLPGMAILILVLAFNLVGNGLRDALDVKNNG